MTEHINFEVANRAVAHLGRHLYGTTPPALAELVANSYDAYAKHVEITHYDATDSGPEMIIVADDGIGMDLDVLKHDYAKIGKEKEEVDKPEGMEERKPMGKKGIGKLAAFSIGREYSVFTKTKGDSTWWTFSLEYDKLLDAESPYKVKCQESDLPDYLERYKSYDQGCIVTITGLRRKWTQSTNASLVSRLSRRFYIPSGKYKFELFLDSAPVNLASNQYYETMDTVVYFGYTQDEIVNLLGEDSQRIDISLQFDKMKANEEKKYEEFVSEKGIKGWIGFAVNPKKLFGNEQENFSNVVVYINGKIADDDLLRNYPDSTYASKYLVGEVIADYLANGTDSDDVVTSSRQGLDNDSEDVVNLIDFVKAARSQAIAVWNDIHKQKGIKALPSYIQENERYSEWAASLTGDALSFNNGIIRCVQALVDGGFTDGEDQEASVMALVNGSIEMVELVNRTNLFQSMSKCFDEGDLADALTKMITFLGKINASEAYSVREVVKGKIGALEKLKRLMSDEAIEKDFQKLISENPWIINPAWRPLSLEVDDESFSSQREAFNRITNGEGEWKKSFIDILITVREGTAAFPAIVELKRNKITQYSKVKFTDIYSQITKYRDALAQSNPDRFTTSNQGHVPAYILLSEEYGPAGSGCRVELKGEEIEMLEDQKIYIRTYDRLITDSKRAMVEERAAMDELSDRPFFSPKPDDQNGR